MRTLSVHSLPTREFPKLPGKGNQYNTTQTGCLYGLSILFLQGVVKCKHISSGFICDVRRVRDDDQDEFESQVLAAIIRLVRCEKGDLDMFWEEIRRC